MTERSQKTPPDDDGPSGAAWWIGLAAGTAIFAFGLVGLLRDARQTIPGDWLTWTAGGLVLHDAVLVPAVLAAGYVLSRLVAPALRAGAQATLAVCAAVALTSVPVLLAEGRRADNPSLLPHDYGANLALVLAAILAAGLLLTLVRARRAASR